jgi:hypothetical protein
VTVDSEHILVYHCDGLLSWIGTTILFSVAMQVIKTDHLAHKPMKTAGYTSKACGRCAAIKSLRNRTVVTLWWFYSTPFSFDEKSLDSDVSQDQTRPRNESNLSWPFC